MNIQRCEKNGRKQKDIVAAHAFLRAIADKNRLKILCFLQDGPKCVCKIFPAVGISQKLASHHLKQMKKVGLLTESRKGNFIHYGIDKKAFKEYKRIFNNLIK